MASGVKTLNLYLSEEDHMRLYRLKTRHGITWSQMLMLGAKSLMDGDKR